MNLIAAITNPHQQRSLKQIKLSLTILEIRSPKIMVSTELCYECQPCQPTKISQEATQGEFSAVQYARNYDRQSADS